MQQQKLINITKHTHTATIYISWYGVTASLPNSGKFECTFVDGSATALTGAGFVIARTVFVGSLCSKDVMSVWIGGKVEGSVLVVGGKVSQLLVVLVEVDVAKGFCTSSRLAVLVDVMRFAVMPKGLCISRIIAIIPLLIDESDTWKSCCSQYTILEGMPLSLKSMKKQCLV